MLERGEIELGRGKGLGARQKGDLGAGGRSLAARSRGPRRSRPNFGERRFGHAVAKPYEPFRSTAKDAQVEMRGKAVDHRNADPVQSTRHLVGVLVELPA